MQTEDLIRALNADARVSAMPIRSTWRIALAGAAAVAAAVFLLTIGPRPDFAEAAHTMRFLFKFVFTLALLLAAFRLARDLSVPGRPARPAAWWLLAAPLLMAIAVVLELLAVPTVDWWARMVGTNSVICLTFIPLIGIGPLALFLAALHHGAPTRPVLAGTVAGLLAGGLSATFYAAHCFDDSPLFVATWYTMAIAMLAGLGALGGRFFVRW
jgi:hypothetical protein